MTQDISQKERELICKRFDENFLLGKYVVCCCSCERETGNGQGEFIYLKDVGEQQVFLVEEGKKELLREGELCNCYVGCSEVFSELLQLDKAYKQACTARKRAFVQCRKFDIYDESLGMEDDESDLAECCLQQIESMVHMVGTNRVDEVIQFVRTSIEEVKNGNVTVDYFWKQISYFNTCIERNYESVLKNKCESALELQQMYRYQTIDEFCDKFEAWIKRIYELISEELDDYKTKQKIQLALSYIHENFSKDLNMAVVSNHISMNYSLFSQVFKQYTGKKFVNYLKELRIKEAKRLLKETDMRVLEISLAVGYENEKHFMKLFKADCGVSPTEYRKSMMLKN